MGGNTTTNSTTTQNNTPWGPAQPSLTNIYAGADQAYAATPKTAYSGSYIAPQSQSTVLSQMLGQQLAGRSLGQGDQITQQATDLFGNLSNQLNNASSIVNNPNLGDYSGTPTGSSADFTSYLNNFLQGTNSNPYLADEANATLQPLYKQLTEGVIPQSKLNAVGSGTYGGQAGDIDMAKSINDNYTTSATNALTGLAYNDYEARQSLGGQAASDYFNRQLQAKTASDATKLQQGQAITGVAGAQNTNLNDFVQNLQSAYALNALPIDTLNQIGTAQDQYSQDTIKALYQQWQDQLNAPWQGLQQYRDAVSGYPVDSTGSSTGSSSGGGLF